MKLPRASLSALLLAQAQETFNDCAAKYMLIGLTQQLARAAGEDPKPVISLIALLLVAPYVLFAPLCGWLADRFPKRTVLNWTLVSQIVVMLLLVAATFYHTLGIDHTQEYHTNTGRPITIVRDGKVIEKLIS